MDVFSLEDEDVSDMFLTQQLSKNVEILPNFDLENERFLENSQVTQMDDGSGACYSDISDAEDFQIPSSQLQNVRKSPR